MASLGDSTTYGNHTITWDISASNLFVSGNATVQGDLVADNLYTKTEADGLLDAKAAIAGQVFTGNISAPNLSGTNTGDQDLSGKADKATTYTETEVDGLLDAKAAISGQAFSGNLSAPNLSGTNTGDQTLREIGVNQVWQDVAASRAQNTNYTNSTGKPIMVSIVVANGSTDSGAIIVDSVGVGAESNAGLVPSQFIVPNGSVYLINSAGILAWSELR